MSCGWSRCIAGRLNLPLVWAGFTRCPGSRPAADTKSNSRGLIQVTNIVVVGSGMAGFGAAHRLKGESIRPVLYERSSYYGGHTVAFRNDNGFLFDLGPHISFTKDPRIQELLAKFVDQEYVALQVKLDNIWRGLRLTHPVQLHLNGLPKDLIVEIILDFVKVHDKPEPPIAN